jgi:hypothetical protein
MPTRAYDTSRELTKTGKMGKSKPFEKEIKMVGK